MDTAGYEEAPQAIEEPVTANGGKSHGKKKGLAASGFQRGMVGDLEMSSSVLRPWPAMYCVKGSTLGLRCKSSRQRAEYGAERS